MTENRRLLIVEDEPEIRRGYREILTPEELPKLASSHAPSAPTEARGPGFELLDAETGERALELLKSELLAGRRFAGAFVDVRMPGSIDGLQFVREAWALDPELLVTVTTAYQDRSVDEIDRFFGTRHEDQWDYLNKPFTAGEVTQKARQMVSSWNRRRLLLDQQAALVAQARLAAVGRLARNVGHEFGNILQPLVGKLDIARARIEKGDTASAISAIDEALDAAALGATVCQDLLVFARESQEQSAPAAIPVERPVRRALALLRHDLAKKDVRVSVSIPAGTSVNCHEPRMVQVYANLFTNALDSLRDGGKLSVTGALDAAGIVVRVADDGGGIPLELRARLFQPLFTTKGDRGNGLGLSVCKRIVEEYGGTIALESEPGRGTTAVLSFPLAGPVK